MLFPDQGVGGHGEQRVEIPRLKRPEIHEVAFQGWLEIERHRGVRARLAEKVVVADGEGAMGWLGNFRNAGSRRVEKTPVAPSSHGAMSTVPADPSVNVR